MLVARRTAHETGTFQTRTHGDDRRDPHTRRRPTRPAHTATTDENRALRIGRAPLVAFVPALALALAVTLLMRAAYDAVGLTAIFWSFGVGVALAAVAEAGNALRVVERETAESALAAGVSLTVAAVLLYAVFGCPA